MPATATATATATAKRDFSIPPISGAERFNGFYVDYNMFENAWLVYDSKTSGLGPIPHEIVHSDDSYFGAIEWAMAAR